jgi:hypothetical protein
VFVTGVAAIIMVVVVVVVVFISILSTDYSAYCVNTTLSSCLCHLRHCFANPVAARSEAWVLSARTLERVFESRLGHGYLFLSFSVVLSSAGTGLATS